MMRYWIVTHRLDLHKTHGDLIGCRPKSNGSKELEACSVNFKKMRKGDRVVVCSRSGDVILGAYNIASDGFTLADDPDWGTAYCYKINLHMKREPYPSFRKFKEEFNGHLEFTRDNNGWEGSSVGWVKEVSESDYGCFLNYLKRPV